MGKEKALIWFDPEADHVEIVFGDDFGRGEMIPTKDKRVQLRVDENGRIIGLMLFSLGSFMSGETPFDLELEPNYAPTKLDEDKRSVIEKVISKVQRRA